jgi:DNA-binding HxlR family transcriptional regulator
MISSKMLNPRVCGVFHEAIELIGRRWTGAIVSVMLMGASRFCEVREAIPGISDRLLTERLKELEDHGIVVREVTDSRPPQVLYRLTLKGEALSSVLDSVSAWAGDWCGEHCARG